MREWIEPHLDRLYGFAFALTQDRDVLKATPVISTSPALAPSSGSGEKITLLIAGNPDLFLAPDFPAVVALNGLEGPVDVKGDHIDGAMPSFDFLSDDEIAAVVKYIRSSFGNDSLQPAGFADVTAADVAARRAKPMAPAEVHDYRASLKK